MLFLFKIVQSLNQIFHFSFLVFYQSLAYIVPDYKCMHVCMFMGSLLQMNNVAIFTSYKCHFVLWSCLCMLREEPETPAAVFELSVQR